MFRGNTNSPIIKHLLASFFAAVLVIASAASWGGTLSDAKTTGLIGEGTNGYIGFVQANVPQDVKDMVSKANDTRKHKYEIAAKKGNTSIRKVEIIGGQRWISKTITGNYIQDSSGAWVKK